MKQILKLILLLVIGQTALAQAPSNYVNINGRYRWIAGMFDSTFHIPKGTTPSLRTGGSTNGGALFYKTADSSLHLYTGSLWLRMLKVGDTTGMLTPYFNSVGVGLKNTGQTVYADTLLLSTRLWRNKGIDSVQANLTAGLATKLNISDTASMLSPYARTVNVRQIVSDSLGGLVRLKALNAGGAALYANSGTKVAEWGLGGSANMDFHGFAGYDINRAGSYTVRSFTDKNYVDSAISASPSGTVTSVATNTGTGITGGTITTSGTIAADTLLLSTRAWRQKGIDSVASLINTRISGTTNYIPKFTSSSAIGNSNIQDNGSTVSITTGSTVLSLDRTGGATALLELKTGGTVRGYLGADVNTPFIFFNGSAAEQMRLTSAGNLGIGISSPTSKLDVYQSSTTQTLMRIEIPNVAQLNIGNGGNSLNYYDGNTQIFRSGTGTERMRLDASGNLGLGNSAPNVPLEVNGAIRTTRSGVASQYLQLEGGDAVGQFITAVGASKVLTIRNNSTTTSQITFDQAVASKYAFKQAGGESMVLDASGNLGLGVTPSAWSLGKAMQFTSGAVWSLSTTDMNYLTNTNYDGSFKYVNSTRALRYFQDASTGIHAWYNAPSGTAGNAISFTQAMTLDASGNLLVGGTSQLYGAAGRGLIQVSGSSQALLGFGTTANVGLGFLYHTGTDFQVINAQNGYLAFGSNNTERMRITSGGELLINTTSDAGDYKLQVNGNVYVNGQQEATSFYTNDTRYISNQIQSGYNTNAEDSDIWINYTGYQGGTTRFRDFRVGDGKQNQIAFFDGSTKNVEFGGSIKTAAPSGGTAAAWKLGERVASSGVTFNDQQYIQLDIGGTLYYLATVDLPMPEAYPQATSGPSNNYKITPVQVKTTRDAEIEKLRKEIEELKQLIKNK